MMKLFERNHAWHFPSSALLAQRVGEEVEG